MNNSLAHQAANATTTNMPTINSNTHEDYAGIVYAWIELLRYILHMNRTFMLHYTIKVLFMHNQFVTWVCILLTTRILYTANSHGHNCVPLKEVVAFIV